MLITNSDESGTHLQPLSDTIGASQSEVTYLNEAPSKRLKGEAVLEVESDIEKDCQQQLNIQMNEDIRIMLGGFAVTAVKVTSSFSVKTFANEFLPKLSGPGKRIKATNYLNALAKLCDIEGSDLAIVATEYEFENKISVQLFDIKCRARFEDEIIEKMYKNWSKKSKNESLVCPFRRGMCVGLINDNVPVLAIGNCKFFYGEEEEILNSVGKEGGTLLLTEKANGEYTMLSSTPPVDGNRWLTVGSKNVRLCLPYVESNPELTKQALSSFIFNYNQGNKTAEEGHRFSYLQEMLDLWLKSIIEKPDLLKELDRGTTLVGEQVGVHAHIFTGYSAPHIRLFGSLPFETLNTSFACDLRDMRNRLFNNSTDASINDPNTPHEAIRLVEFSDFKLPEQLAACVEEMRKVTTGSMDIYGEGVVIYSLDQLGRSTSLFKFKCQEYAFDRRLRTVLSRTAGALQKSSLTKLKLRDESTRVIAELRKAFKTQFNQMNPVRAEERIELVPALVAFLDRHQATIYCSDFSDQFVSLVNTTAAKKSDYLNLASKNFLDVNDELQDEYDNFRNQFAQISVPTHSIEHIANEILQHWKEEGGHAKFNCIGIASAPGGGKTAVLHKVLELMEKESLPAKLCDRDAYCIADPQAKGDVIHRIWTEDISRTAKSGVTCLVGNTFSGGFADKLEAQTKTKILLFALKENTVPVSPKRLIPQKPSKEDYERCQAALFDLICLRRLSERIEVHADGSTLTMDLGCQVVLEKFFSSQPDEAMLKRRLKEKSAFLIEAVEPQKYDIKQMAELAKAIIGLKNTVSNPRGSKASNSKKEDSLAFTVRIPRSNAAKYTFEYYAASSTKPKVRYAGLLADQHSARLIHEIADVDLYRSDGHITLTFGPSEDDLKQLLASYDSITSLKVNLTAKVTVVKQAPGINRTSEPRLQFAVCEITPEQQSLLPEAAHVTLGSTNPEILPHFTSGMVLAAMKGNFDKHFQIGAVPYGPVLISVEKNVYSIWIEAFDKPVEFNGVPTMFCSSK